MAIKDTSALYTEAQTLGLAIAFFRLPGEKKVSHISGKVIRTLSDGRKGFAFASFDKSTKRYFIIPSERVSSIKVSTIKEAKQKSTSKKAFTEYVKSIVKSITAGDYQKIVAARVLATAKPANFEPAIFFEKLCAAYPTAFVSLTYIPHIGLWIGASPEVLASQHAATLTTYALAGTKAVNDETEWSDKEKVEQRIVTEFIGQKLTKITGEGVKTKGPFTQEAGSLKHLLTVFTLRSKENGLWQKVSKALHPTPAVAGLPQAKSVKYIAEHELFDRKFYAGYLGPVNWNAKTDLFVNLRCMEVTAGQLIFYAGCGITADSDPEKEWQESERKIEVLKSLI